jgi:hypothetical protein
VAAHARGTAVGLVFLDQPRLWALVLPDTHRHGDWQRYRWWLDYLYGPVTLKAMNPDGTWRPWVLAEQNGKEAA